MLHFAVSPSYMPPKLDFKPCLIVALLCSQVYLPSALTGGSTSSDPKIRELNNELNEVNRKILNNDLEIPPEGERSPSPEPIYDRNGKAFTNIAHECLCDRCNAGYSGS